MSEGEEQRLVVSSSAPLAEGEEQRSVVSDKM